MNIDCILAELQKLHSLNLSHTRIGNSLLRSGVLNSMRELGTLDLSSTRISTRGVFSISIPALTRLNLTATRVRAEAVLPLLQGVSVRVGAMIQPEDDWDSQAE